MISVLRDWRRHGIEKLLGTEGQLRARVPVQKLAVLGLCSRDPVV